MKEFQGSVALITGGASGIGRCLGERLVRYGATVVLADIDGDAVREVAGRLGCTGVSLDVRDPAAFQALATLVIAEHGQIDYLFNNAGVAQTGPAHLMEHEDWRRIIDVNLYGVIHGVEAVYPHMVARGSGHIVNVASIAGLFPSAGQTPYTASKYGVVGLSHALRAEAAWQGVKVTVACPGIIHTPMRRGLPVKGADADAVRRIIPKGASVDRCVDAMLAGVARGRATVLITPLAHALATLMRVSPELGHRFNTWSMGFLRRRLGMG